MWCKINFGVFLGFDLILKLFKNLIKSYYCSVQDDIGLGTVVGSAVYNVTFVIGVCALFAGMVSMHCRWESILKQMFLNSGYTICTRKIVSLFSQVIMFLFASTGFHQTKWGSIVCFQGMPLHMYLMYTLPCKDIYLFIWLMFYTVFKNNAFLSSSASFIVFKRVIVWIN